VQPGSPPQLGRPGSIEAELLDPVSAFDLDGDGQLEILNVQGGLGRSRSLIQRRGAALESMPLLDVLDLDCPC